MAKEISEINWTHVMNKFSTYDGVINHFCKENNIKPYQLFYQRKKLEKETKPTFHAIALNKKESIKPTITNIHVPGAKDIRIEIGKANVYVPANEIALLTDIIQILAK